MQIRPMHEVEKRRNRKSLLKSEAETFCKFLCKNLNYQNAVKKNSGTIKTSAEPSRRWELCAKKLQNFTFSVFRPKTFCVAYKSQPKPFRNLGSVWKCFVMFHLLEPTAMPHCIKKRAVNLQIREWTRFCTCNRMYTNFKVITCIRMYRYMRMHV